MRRVLTPGWVLCHLVTVVLVCGMLGLAAWQYFRAAGGNAMSWGYFLQWPVFAGFAVYIWWREVRRVLRGHDGDRPDGAAPHGDAPAGADSTVRRPVITRRPAPVGADDHDDPELAAYNEYLAWMRAHPGARPADYPGG